MERIVKYVVLLTLVIGFIACEKAEEQNSEVTENRFTTRGYNFLSSNEELNLQKLDTAVAYGVNHIELSHYQLCHFLKDLKDTSRRKLVNYYTQEAHDRGIEEVFLWDHAFYNMSYYPDRFKLEAEDQDLSHHAGHFEGGKDQQLNLDDPEFWEWVYNDYDTLLSYAPDVDGIVLTFIETGSYVLYQHSEKLKTPQEKIAALVDSLANYFIEEKGKKLTIRTFIYNQFEKEKILGALKLIKNQDIKVMVKMVPHDWFMTYPYQDYIADIPFPVIIEYDCGLEYAGENVILGSFAKYYGDAFKHYSTYDNVVGYCARTDRYETTSSVGTPGELNLYTLSRLSDDTSLSIDEITKDFIVKNYGEDVFETLKPVFDSAYNGIMASMYTLGEHTANHSRLNFHRSTIYHSHTSGEWYDPDDQMVFIKHGVNKEYHMYKDIVNQLAFPVYKVDTPGIKRDIEWVLDSGWLEPGEKLTMELFNDVVTEKSYAVDLAEKALKAVEESKSMIKNQKVADDLYKTTYRTVIFCKLRKAGAEAVYGYRLYCKGKEYQTPELKAQILAALALGDELLTEMKNMEDVPMGQWRWARDGEAFEIYKKAITETGWVELGMTEVLK